MPRHRVDRETNRRIAGHLGRIVRAARGGAAMTQEALAEQIEITPEAFGRVEGGLSVPSFPTLLKLCDALGLTANDLLHGDAPPRTLGAREPARSVELNEILRHASSGRPGRSGPCWAARELAARTRTPRQACATPGRTR